jgi:hypothetical protein
MNPEFTNPKMRCKNYSPHLTSIPEHCYNCTKRKGLPVYIFGDEHCKNFEE